MVWVTILLCLTLDVPSVQVDQRADEYDRDRHPAWPLEINFVNHSPHKSTHSMATVISVAMLVLVGFSQVLLALLLLHVAVDEDESVVLDEDRPSTRLGNMFQALFTISSSEVAATLLPIGTRGPKVGRPSCRAIISSILTSQRSRILSRRNTQQVDELE